MHADLVAAVQDEQRALLLQEGLQQPRTGAGKGSWSLCRVNPRQPADRQPLPRWQEASSANSSCSKCPALQNRQGNGMEKQNCGVFWGVAAPFFPPDGTHKSHGLGFGCTNLGHMEEELDSSPTMMYRSS